MNEMKRNTIGTLLINGFSLTHEDEKFSYYFKGNGVLVSYTEPHEGTSWRHLIRAVKKEEFNGWDNIKFHGYFTNEKEENEVLEKLVKMLNW